MPKICARRVGYPFFPRERGIGGRSPAIQLINNFPFLAVPA